MVSPIGSLRRRSYTARQMQAVRQSRSTRLIRTRGKRSGVSPNLCLGVISKKRSRLLAALVSRSCYWHMAKAVTLFCIIDLNFGLGLPDSYRSQLDQHLEDRSLTYLVLADHVADSRSRIARVGWQTQASTNDCSASFLPYFVLLSYIIDTQAISPAYIPVEGYIFSLTSPSLQLHVDDANSEPRAHVSRSGMPPSRLSPERLSPILSEQSRLK